MIVSKISVNDLNKIKEEYDSNENNYKKILNNLELLLEGQEVTQKNLQLGFIGLATQNHKLIKLNESLNHQLERVENELNMLKQEREEKASRKEARANRKGLPKREPVTREIYNLLIQAVGRPTYTSVRLRIAFCLLTVTGIRINELLPLKVVQTL